MGGLWRKLASDNRPSRNLSEPLTEGVANQNNELRRELTKRRSYPSHHRPEFHQQTATMIGSKGAVRTADLGALCPPYDRL